MKILLVLDKSQKEVFKVGNFLSKNCKFVKVWGAASIGDAATIRNFIVVGLSTDPDNQHIS